jgi:hypothetical protein
VVDNGICKNIGDPQKIYVSALPQNGAASMQTFIPFTLITLILDFNALLIKKAKSGTEPVVLFSVLLRIQMALSLLFLQADIKCGLSTYRIRKKRIWDAYRTKNIR